MRTVGRRRQSNHHLPPRMHLKDGCYYHVSSMAPRRWTKLDKDLSKARILWAQIENGPCESELFSTRLDEWLVSPKFKTLADKTRRQYEYVAIELREFFEGAKVTDITPAHIALWMDKHKSAIQANTGKAITSNVLEIAVRHGLIDTNPAKQIGYHTIKGRDRLITDDEYRKIWQAAEPHVRIAMDFGYLTGTRIQDILDIKLQDITDEGVFIKQGKTKKRMLFIMSDALESVIASARALPRPIRGMHLLCNHYGQPYKYCTFNLHWLNAVRSVGIEDLHFHDIRGKAATDAKALGLDYQKLLGHTTKAMSDKYIKVRQIDRVETLAKVISARTL